MPCCKSALSRRLISLLSATFICLAPSLCLANEPTPSEPWTLSLGAGIERMPSFSGSRHGKTMAVPFVDASWHDQVSLSTTDGLTIDLIHGEHWHGGLTGTLLWGRSYKDLNELVGKVRPLGNTLQAGSYVEYAVSEAFDAGLRLSHDIQSTGAAYATAYADIGLPSPGAGMLHGIKLSADWLNTSAMGRFYGIHSDEARALNSSTYQPGAGIARVALGYQAYVPVSAHLGVVVSAEFGRLQGQARHSPLISQYGATTQRNLMASLAYRF